jgi:hypothetical protein
MPVAEYALWNGGLSINCGDCAPGKVCLAHVVQDWRDLFARANSMWALHSISEDGDL